MKSRRLAIRWWVLVVAAVTVSLLGYAVAASEVAHAGLRWSGID